MPSLCECKYVSHNVLWETFIKTVSYLTVLLKTHWSFSVYRINSKLVTIDHNGCIQCRLLLQPFSLIHQPQANWPSLTFQTFICLSESDLALPFPPNIPSLPPKMFLKSLQWSSQGWVWGRHLLNSLSIHYHLPDHWAKPLAPTNNSGIKPKQWVLILLNPFIIARKLMETSSLVWTALTLVDQYYVNHWIFFLIRVTFLFVCFCLWTKYLFVGQ